MTAPSNHSTSEEPSAPGDTPIAAKGPIISVLVCDPHPLMRAGIRWALEQAPDIVVLGETGDGAKIEPLVSQLRPDILLIAMSLPHVDCAEIMRRLRSSGSAVKVVVLTTFAERQYVEQVILEGGRGYLLKLLCDEECLVGAIRAVSKGNVVLTATSADLLLQDRDGHAIEDEGYRLGLTRRQVALLSYVAQGLSNKEIAERLHTSEGTVKTYLTETYAKLGVRSRSQAVVSAIRFGLISPFDARHSPVEEGDV